MSKPKKAKKSKRQKLSCLKFEDLPNELVIGTLSYLNMKDLINCSQVSKRFRAIVVDEQGRRKEDLLKIIQDLQCFQCKKVPRPYGNQNKRYLCEKSHSLCERHKKYKVEKRLFWRNGWNDRFEKKCSCGSLVEENPSQSIAKKLQNLPWMCQNYQWGCREVKMDVNNLETHHGKCIFRKVFCPSPACKASVFERLNESLLYWGTKVCFKDIFDHLNTVHKNNWYEINGESNKWMVMIKMKGPQGYLKDGRSWDPSKMTSTNGDVFSLVARVHK